MTTIISNSGVTLKSFCVVLIGVSSCGKSSVGEALANRLDAKFIDGDDLHTRHNLLKMSSGQALNDNDRAPWLERIRDAVFSIFHKHERGVLVCSALKKAYRDKIRDGNPNVLFIHLQGSIEVIAERMQARQDHFMPLSLLQSQFDALEVPDQTEPDVRTVTIDDTFENVVTQCQTTLMAYFNDKP
ncbi:gluconokinase [Celerinatantimonas diazotrophica]|uniref:Gluconokinase n=1 Tax=Celerinatantimonas diazotrophica TaxID=412034 RepID=A0A4R1K5F9_9GAMM|nr:gluconokinase [Celerinatantimonas diazotrophica]TCK58983.1 gluconate kinase (SKI family) [Celerinatantimonas diazotrophica]CAG9297618.1 Thermoresistant gluconokinase [Celerinatantimonas diazotrophica]